MSVSVTMPRLGESVTEGTVTRWLKNEGDQVEADEPLLEVSTDKVDTEVPSPASGVLTSIKVREDETVDIGVELAVIGDSADGGEAPVDDGPAETDDSGAQPAADDAAAESTPSNAPPEAEETSDEPAGADEPTEPAPSATSAPEPAEEPAPKPEPKDTAPAVAPANAAPPPAQAPAPAPARTPAQAEAPATAPAAEAGRSTDGDADDDVAGTYVTPLVRRLASENGVDLASVTGTGVGGRIRKSDVLAAAERSAETLRDAEAAERSQAAQAARSAPEAHAAEEAAQQGRPAPATDLRGRVEKMSRRRQLIAARMVESLQVSAQLTTVVEVDVTIIARLRERAKADFQSREGVKLTFLPFFAAAVVEALKVHPVLSCSIDTEQKTITYHGAEHLGIAVDTEAGLTVPVIHDAGDLNLGGLARKIADLAERTRSNKISPDELGGGTFTLTNTGSRGALFDTPIINQPQVGILGTGTVVKRPVVITDPNLGETIAVRSMVYLALSYDHRIVDGADAARFLATVKERLEGGNFERALGLS
jgi:pyruvate dehydrogenase E2 component (dihydrolipoamide acetyltransferase)